MYDPTARPAVTPSLGRQGSTCESRLPGEAQIGRMQNMTAHQDQLRVDELFFMKQWVWLAVLGLAVLTPAARAQRPYIGFVYPAGGQQGTTVQVRFGGQGMEQVNAILVSGTGVVVRSSECFRRLDNSDINILTDQLKDLKRAPPAPAAMMMAPMAPEPAMMSMMNTGATAVGAGEGAGNATSNLILEIEKRIRDFVQTPASLALAAITVAEFEIAPDAPPGEREVRLVTARGISNPLIFQIGQLPEVSRKPMRTANFQILGKEAAALRKRPKEEVEDRITIPCTVNGQIASGESNRYRFMARKGQRLVLATLGRQLIPYIADAVPGWFQPVLVLMDATGKELVYGDDYRFQPDPVIFYEVPQDGEYVFAIRDAIYRGREDFVYRITVGELPFVTSIFPLGSSVGAPVGPQVKGWNLPNAELTMPAQTAGPGVYQLAANRQGYLSNRVPFALDTLPECNEIKPNQDRAHAQRVALPVIINGRIDKPGDWGVFQFTGQSNAVVVAEVRARRLDSPLDSVLKLTDAKGQLLAYNDDCEDLADGLNTHHADSYLMVKLPADGTYYVHIGDTAHNGGAEYAFRLRLSAPRPGFALRVTPSSVSLRGRDSASVTAYAIRRDGFTGPIQIGLKSLPPGFSSQPVTLAGTQTVVRLALKTSRITTNEPLNLTVLGWAKIGDQIITNAAVPAEDRMQAFLWRHLVPAQDLKVLVYDPTEQPPGKRTVPVRPAHPVEAPPVAGETNAPVAAMVGPVKKPNFTKKQVASRLRDLKRLYEAGVLTDEFYWDRVAECDTAQ